MLAKRIIPCLDIKDGRTVKGVRFEELRDAGDPVELAKFYAENGADELVFLDITATTENRKTLVSLVTRIAESINIPFTVGGGISTIEDVEILLNAGADKISINSAAVKNPELITRIASKFGSQCVVVAVDANVVNGEWLVFTSGGKNQTTLNLYDWCNTAAKKGAGEILFTSMAHDGTKNGFAIEPLKKISAELPIPVIASGGAGNIGHFVDLFTTTSVEAALAASIFHFGEVKIEDLKKQLELKAVPIR